MILTIFIQKLYIEVLLQKEHLLFYDVGPRRQRKMLVVLAVEAEPSHHVFHYTLLLCDRWQQGGSLTEWRLTSKCIRCKGVSLISLQKKWHLLAFFYVCWKCLWIFLVSKQWMRAHRGGGLCISAKVMATWKTSHIPDSHEDFFFMSTACRLLFIAAENA